MNQIPAHILGKMLQVLDGAIVKRPNGCIWFNIDRPHISLNNKNVVRVRMFEDDSESKNGSKEYCKSALQLIFYKHYGYFPPRNHVLKPICNCLNCGNIAHLILDTHKYTHVDTPAHLKTLGVFSFHDSGYLPVRRNYKAEKRAHDSGAHDSGVYTSICVSVTGSGSDEEIMERVRYEYDKANEQLNELIDEHFKDI